VISVAFGKKDIFAETFADTKYVIFDEKIA
jgi:hypothetical protein